MSGSYREAFERAARDPEGFWAEAAEGVAWHRRWDRVLDRDSIPATRWFVGGETNACWNAVDRHVEDGRGGQAAIVHDSPVTGAVRTLSFAELQDQVSRFAGVLRSLGVGMGDRVLIYMPMVPETAVAMLACARLGAIHSVVFGGFAANELAVRIDDAKPVAVVAGSCGIEPGRVVAYKPMLDQAIERAAHKVGRCVIFQRDPERAALVPRRDVDWDESMAAARPADWVPVPSEHPLYILYTSGTTGAPKGVVRDTGGSIAYLNWTMKPVYGVEPGEAWWAAADLGWQAGHCYTAYAPLLHGNTTVLFEGKPVGTPDAGTFWRVIEQHRVVSLFTAPTAFRAIKREDPKGEFLHRHDLSHLRTLFLAGERSDGDTVAWAERQLGVPVIDHWWQTETGGPSLCTCMGYPDHPPPRASSPGLPVPGWDIRILTPEGEPAMTGEDADIVIKMPMPPGALTGLWGAEDRFRAAYFEDHPGYYKTGDSGHMDEDGYVYVMGRTDDVINVAGHRLSTGAMEEVLAGHPDVAECAVVGVADDMKGQVPLGFLVLKAGVNRPPEEIVAEVVAAVREAIGPVAAFKSATVVPRLPKTRSGKIIRRTMQSIADGREYKTPATIDDPAILGEIEEALRDLGYAKAE